MIAYLDVTVGVPVHVVDDDGVGRSEIDPEASRLRRQQKDERVGMGICETDETTLKCKNTFKESCQIML